MPKDAKSTKAPLAFGTKVDTSQYIFVTPTSFKLLAWNVSNPPSQSTCSPKERATAIGSCLHKQVGSSAGIICLQGVDDEELYESLLAHPWIKQNFNYVPRSLQELEHTDGNLVLVSLATLSPPESAFTVSLPPVTKQRALVINLSCPGDKVLSIASVNLGPTVEHDARLRQIIELKSSLAQANGWIIAGRAIVEDLVDASEGKADAMFLLPDNDETLFSIENAVAFGKDLKAKGKGGMGGLVCNHSGVCADLIISEDRTS